MKHGHAAELRHSWVQVIAVRWSQHALLSGIKDEEVTCRCRRGAHSRNTFSYKLCKHLTAT